jgi:TolB protein
MRFLLPVLILIFNLCCLTPAFAALNLELTKGVASALPIAIVPFKGEEESPIELTEIIHHDLNNSGEFNVLSDNALKAYPHTPLEIDAETFKAQNINDVVVGEIKKQNANQYEVSYSLVDTYSQASPTQGVLLSEQFVVNAQQLRRLAHHISDRIYERLTGDRGVFSTKIAYVLVSEPTSSKPRMYQLEVSDIDGFNAKPILTSTQPIMSPAWSPDGTKIAYVSFESYLPQIYISDVASGSRKLLTSFSGINGAPAWSPDGRQLAVALSRGGNNPNLYLIDLSSHQLQQLTNDLSINTEPRFSPDGHSLIFTSDRGGSPQLYQLSLNTKTVQRLTYNGNYNATGSYTPDGAAIALLHRSDDTYGYNIGFMNLQSGDIKQLTNNGKNQSPSLAPNGKMIVFASESGGGRAVLGIVSTNGKVSLRIPDQNGSVEQPAWSPLLGTV